ncbi:MAG: OmpA family protein [Phycisphaerae bacterium]|nr:OmpA family protein [Phycisphaerae bacterium]
MKHAVKKMVVVCSVMVAISMLTGCTNWKKKYNSLDVEHQNLKGLYESCITSLDTSAEQQARMSQELENLKKQLAQGKTASQATGFKGDVKVDEAAGTITVTLSNSILFSSGKATLKNATSSELDDIYRVLRERYSGSQVDVVGHTDTDPIVKTKNLWKDNWDLSAGRALTVLRYLVDKGVRPEKVRGVACGQARPVASNATAAGKAKNRRVEIVVHMR